LVVGWFEALVLERPLVRERAWGWEWEMGEVKELV
jgi:hypothetical protein